MPKRILQGTVTGDQNAQTITVSVQRAFQQSRVEKNDSQVKEISGA